MSSRFPPIEIEMSPYKQSILTVKFKNYCLISLYLCIHSLNAADVPLPGTPTYPETGERGE